MFVFFSLLMTSLCGKCYVNTSQITRGVSSGSLHRDSLRHESLQYIMGRYIVTRYVTSLYSMTRIAKASRR